MQTYIIDVWQNESIWTWQGQAESEEAAQEAARVQLNSDWSESYATWDALASYMHGTATRTQDPLTAAAPAMLAALQRIASDSSAWGECVNIAADAIAAATGSPTGGAEPASPTDDTEAEAQTYTAFCQQSDGRGTIWIDTVEVPAGTDNPIRDARERAIAACSFDWNYDPASVHCLGLVLGDATVCYWDDLADA